MLHICRPARSTDIHVLDPRGGSAASRVQWSEPAQHRLTTAINAADLSRLLVVLHCRYNMNIKIYIILNFLRWTALLSIVLALAMPVAENISTFYTLYAALLACFLQLTPCLSWVHFLIAIFLMFFPLACAAPSARPAL